MNPNTDIILVFNNYLEQAGINARLTQDKFSDEELLDVLTKKGILQKSGTWRSFEGKPVSKGGEVQDRELFKSLVIKHLFE
jgi:hypothetical protein